MSRKTKLSAGISAVIAKMPMSHLSREFYDRVGSSFAEFLVRAGYTHLADPDQLCGRHFRDYIDSIKSPAEGQPLSIRSMQNVAASLRQIYRAAGRGAVADAPELTNAALGISGGSRRGTKSPPTPEELYTAVANAEDQNRPGIAAIIRLASTFGLRHFEALMASEETLARWRIELACEGAIEVVRGTKGGRSRRTRVGNVLEAIAVVDAALDVAKSQGGYLVTQKNGEPARDLRQARSIARNWMHRNGIVAHALRYAYAERRFRDLTAAGIAPREALSMLALDLGHGSGRGRWARSVYLRGLRCREGDATTTSVVDPTNPSA
jgi:hypothetical protein